MTNICNLPRDLAEEVLCRIPLTSLRRVRSTCRKWNTLSKDKNFANKHLAQVKLAAAQGKGTMMVMMMGYRVCLMRFYFSTNVVESCIKPEGKLVGRDGSDEIDVCQVFYCDGLLLCVPKDYTKLVVWNPYWGQTRLIKPSHCPYKWIKPTPNLYGLDLYTYALGYDKSSNSHKILSILSPLDLKIYDFNSDSWRVLDVPRRDWIKSYKRGVSLKGNTYWYATWRSRVCDVQSCLLCFDFTRKIFGPCLPLPFEAWRSEDSVSLSSVREEQLAVLLHSCYTLQMEIWITTKIEPDAVSWSSKVFLSANIEQLIHPKWKYFHTAPSFFIDEEKKVVVVSGRYEDIQNRIRDVAYIIGVDGSLKEADVRESAYMICNALVFSYVPSLVQLN